MPIMKPEHQKAMLNAAKKVMASAGIEGAREPAPADASVKELLNNAGLSLEDTLTNLAIIANGGNEGLRARAIDTILKMHGVLKESAVVATPTFTIVINDGKVASTIPAISCSIPEGVNPIFLPRQLLSQLQNEQSKDSN